MKVRHDLCRCAQERGAGEGSLSDHLANQFFSLYYWNGATQSQSGEYASTPKAFLMPMAVEEVSSLIKPSNPSHNHYDKWLLVPVYGMVDNGEWGMSSTVACN